MAPYFDICFHAYFRLGWDNQGLKVSGFSPADFKLNRRFYKKRVMWLNRPDPKFIIIM